ncbi:hypothetical protein NZD89_17145 [Alicyclobacillus fastidiosus]|uniref:Uncharacterized protein n=1 Tax=Alicyclobacillus fastidiosus TaxID=392011 RepID=A0ABY6ZB45_9BACL|nr:hypothetical protein [Alicyclobacillus fastidiosus]WAH40110.1 hypothetical protein NZD89_17145 [Alicyclobacillus fastidiosus]GMA61437.1 hypothetical protein GCM10025859_18770 [Alicyclobacillus fastidiosus]
MGHQHPNRFSVIAIPAEDDVTLSERLGLMSHVLVTLMGRAVRMYAKDDPEERAQSSHASASEGECR